MLKRILEKFNMKNRGIKTRTLDNGKDYLYVLRNNNYPAILVECAFIDNKSDMDKLNTAEKVKTMGTQIGIGIEDTVK
nr:N-acetylmuramoyl-L-alanine amidase [Clostridioides difficile]